MIKYDYSKLRGKIREARMSQGELAKRVGIDPATLSKSLNNKRDFARTEMFIIHEVLCLPNYEDYFFVVKPAK